MSEKSQKDKETIICRCEDVSLSEIREVLKRGYNSFVEVKRVTRCGMGICQGKTCREMVLREISSFCKKSPQEIGLGKFRPPVNPVKLEIVKKSKEVPVLETEILVIGAGPAGLSAALSAGSMGARVIVIDRNSKPGGQLIKQIHRFFGSKDYYSSVRGIEIANFIQTKLKEYNIDLKPNTTALGFYEDQVVLAESKGSPLKIKAKRYVIATGAFERMIPFPNNDLPGVYGAGAVQTLVNLYGVIPGKKVLMVGSGNVGLIVTYQLLQAGIKVCAIVEAASKIGGYLVHASKVRRMGVPIYVSHTIKEVYGKEKVEGAVIWQLDENWNPVPGTEKEFEVDVVCLAVGLSPLTELLWQAGCKMKFVPELGGYVPVRNKDYQTTNPSVYVAGDAAGIEEATTAMIEGKIAGLSAAQSLGYNPEECQRLKEIAFRELEEFRSGPVGERIKRGIEKLLH